MGLDKGYRSSERVISRISWVANSAGAGVLVVMMFLIVIDVLLRYFLNRPLKGVFELIEFMVAIVVCLGMAYTGVQKGHVAVELVVSRFSPRVQALIDSFNYLVSTILFLLISWKSVVYAKVLWVSGLTSAILYVPVYPFVFVLGLCSGLLGLVFLLHFIDSISRMIKR